MVRWLRLKARLKTMPVLPLLEQRHRHDFNCAAHLAVAQAAEFRAGDLVNPRGFGVESIGDLHTGNGVLFEAQFADEEVVDDIARMEGEYDVTASGDFQCGGDDVVAAGGVGGVDAERIAGWIVDVLKRCAAELAIRAWVAEIPGELAS